MTTIDRIGRCALALLSLLAAGCVSFATAHAEFDSVARFVDGAEPVQATYQEKPERDPLLIRLLDGLEPLHSGLRYALRIEPTPSAVDNPAEFARERLTVLGDETGSDLQRIAIAARRCVWVAEVNVEQPLNRVVAIHGIVRLLSLLGADPLSVPPPDPAMTETKVAGLLDVLKAGWPETRATAVLGPDERAAYAAALAELTHAPLPQGPDRRALLAALAAAVAGERDPELIEPARQALRTALHSCMSTSLVQIAATHGTVGDEPVVGRVREAALSGLHQLTSADSVPRLLALAAGPATGGGPTVRYDTDRFVRLALIRMSGQLDRERALRSHATGPAAVEVLYEIAMHDPEPGLRLAALEGLAHCLGRPVSFDPAWAEAFWRDQYVPNRAAGSNP